MQVRFTARPGHGEELAAVLLEAADGLAGVDACRLYLVSRSPDDAEAVWVTEAWTSRDAHAASLEQESAQELIRRGLPLLAGPPEATELQPLGGKGW